MKAKAIPSQLQWLAAAPMLATIGVGVAIGAACSGAAWALGKLMPKRDKTHVV